MNTVILKGNLTRDPEMRITPSGMHIASLGLAINETRVKEGVKIERPHYFDLTAFGKTAEVIVKHHRKGDPILIKGRLTFDQWEKDGEKRSKVSVVVENFDFIKPFEKKDESAPSSQKGPEAENLEVLDEEPPF